MVGRDHPTLHVGFVDSTPLQVHSPIMDPRRLFQVSLGHVVTTRLNKRASTKGRVSTDESVQIFSPYLFVFSTLGTEVF